MKFTVLLAFFVCVLNHAHAEALEKKGRVIKVYPQAVSDSMPTGAGLSTAEQGINSQLNKEAVVSVPVVTPQKKVGIDIFKGTVNENIIRLAKEELGIPRQNVEFMYLPCDLVEKYTYTIPEEKLNNKYERLTYYASQYSFFATFSPITNTVTLEYRGPDVFSNCRKAR